MENVECRAVDLQKALMEAGILPELCARVVIDIPAQGAVLMYYECLGSEKLLKINLPKHLKNVVKININEKNKSP